MKHLIAACLIVILAPACSPLRSTATLGFGTAKFAGKTAWAVGTIGAKVATVPLRSARGGSSSSSGGGSYRVRGRTYHLLDQQEARHYQETGIASFYSGGKTANGERVNSRALTAAHTGLPFGTRVRVTNLANRRSITVRINDRGPFIRGRIIDLTKRGADALGFREQGLTKVRVETLDTAFSE